MKKILVINGPNLNLLGTREPHIYGDQTLDQIEQYTRQKLGDKIEMEWFQSNSEGAIIDRLQAINQNDIVGVIINPGGYAHSSVAIHDSLKCINVYKIEAHISNTVHREEFRHKKITGRACHAVIEGFGKETYLIAANAILIKEGNL